jgi:SMODS and SLOG-associating 2TM effector domain 3/SMODS and SLOG-associating 2TM effector domain 1
MEQSVGTAISDRPLTPVDYPALFRAADARSLVGQRAYTRLTGVELLLVIIGSLLGVAGAILSVGWQIAAGAAAFSFLGALGIRLLIRLRGDDQAWFDGRAVAESVKTQAWRYMMRIPPFAADAEADRRFASDAMEILHARPSIQAALSRLPGDALQITPRMREIRAGELAARLRIYAEQRLRDQTEWYRTRGERHASISGRWSVAAVVTEAVAVGIAILMIEIRPLSELGLLGLLGSAAAAFSAWAQLGRHAELSRSYGLAFQELLILQSLVATVDSEERLKELVDAGEGAISREHSMWVARRGEPAPE